MPKAYRLVGIFIRCFLLFFVYNASPPTMNHTESSSSTTSSSSLEASIVRKQPTKQEQAAHHDHSDEGEDPLRLYANNLLLDRDTGSSKYSSYICANGLDYDSKRLRWKERQCLFHNVGFINGTIYFHVHPERELDWGRFDEEEERFQYYHPIKVVLVPTASRNGP